MEVLKRLVAVFFLLVAASVAANWVATPLYHDGTFNYWVWEALNWPMAVAIGLALIVNVQRKLGLDSGESITRQYLEVNLAFYASIVLAMWFYWNWFFGFFRRASPRSSVRSTFSGGPLSIHWWCWSLGRPAPVYGARPVPMTEHHI